MLLLFKRYNCSQSVLIFNSRLHGRYHELAPHLVPMDYTNDPDCKLPLALIVNMPELKVNKINLSLNHLKHDASPVMSLVKSFLMDQPLFFLPITWLLGQCVPALCFLILDCVLRTLLKTNMAPTAHVGRRLINKHSLSVDRIDSQPPSSSSVI